MIITKQRPHLAHLWAVAMFVLIFSLSCSLLPAQSSETCADYFDPYAVGTPTAPKIPALLMNDQGPYTKPPTQMSDEYAYVFSIPGRKLLRHASQTIYKTRASS